MRQFKPGQLQTGSLYPITASYALTASYLSGSVSIDTGSLVTTASFNAFTASYTTGSFTGSFRGDGSQLTGIVSSKWTGSNPISRQSDVEITGSLRVQGSITGSLFGTASWATNAVTASYVQTAQTASYVLQAVSASFATSASRAVSSSFATTTSFAETSSAAMLTFAGPGDTRSFALTMVVSSSFAPPVFSSPRNPSPLVIRDEIIFNGLTKVLQTTASVALTASIATTASHALQANNILPLGGNKQAGFITYVNSTGSYQYVKGYHTFKIDITDTDVTTINLTGSLIASSITSSLQGTASFATSASQAVSSSFANTATSASFAPSTPTFPYTGSALITGSLGITGSLSVIDGSGTSNLNTNVRTLYGSNGSSSIDWEIRKLYDTSGAGVVSLDWRTRDLTDTYASASINWSSRILTDSGTPGGSGIPVTSIDWENRQANDQFNVTSTDWSNRVLYDGSGVTSTDWSSRALYDLNANLMIAYGGGDGLNIVNYRPTIEDLSSDAQEDFTQGQIFSLNGNVAGNIITVNTNVDLAVTASNPVFLDTDGIWKRSDQTTDTTTKLLGICVEPYNKGQILTEGMITVTTASGYPDSMPFVSGSSFYGMPVYLTGSAAAFTTTKPTSGYVRVVGHMYYNSTTTPDYWIMKFNPSNDWYEI